MSPVQALRRGPVAGWLGDVHAVLVRNLLQLRRSPEIIAFSLTQPIMFVLLFTQVYGGAVHVQGSDYTQFLMAGVFGQTIVFGSMTSGVYMAEDLKEGIIDRFRTLPMAPSAILMARTLADLAVELAAPLIVVTSTGLGSLNLAELTVMAARARGITVLGLIGGSLPTNPDLATRLNLTEFPVVTGVPLLGCLPENCGDCPPEHFKLIAQQITLPRSGQ